VRSIVIRSVHVSVCLCVCSISQKQRVQTSRNFLYMLTVAVAWSSCDDSAMCYILRVFWMTPCFRIMHSGARRAESVMTSCFVELARWPDGWRSLLSTIALCPTVQFMASKFLGICLAEQSKNSSVRPRLSTHVSTSKYSIYRVSDVNVQSLTNLNVKLSLYLSNLHLCYTMDDA